MANETFLSFFHPMYLCGVESGMVSKRELLALTRDIEETRRIRNALVSSAAYHTKEWTSQLRKLKDQNIPQDELDRVNETWELQHKKALLLKSKLEIYNKEQLMLVDEALAVLPIATAREPAEEKRPDVDAGPRRHQNRTPTPEPRKDIMDVVREERMQAKCLQGPTLESRRGRSCKRG